MKMDSSIINREGVEKLLTMLPTEEEISRIQGLYLIECQGTYFYERGAIQ